MHRLRSLLIVGLLMGGSVSLWAHDPVVRPPTPVRIPDLPGFLTLKCDFHTHTVFSDGLVWPTVRAEEAWREGLDAIAITDHIEYQPHKADVSTNHNRAFDIAQPRGHALDVIVIRGSEITRAMPPGHLNAIFLTNSAALAVENWRDALAEANRQGAFVFWNHPGWSAQLQQDGVVRWYDEHTELLKNGQLHGIEVVNSREYYPEAFRWALEERLTLLSNSDIHNPLNMDYHVHAGDHRPLTLVFARERTALSIHEALRARRTAVYSNNRMMGQAEFLEPLFRASIEVMNPRVTLRGQGSVLLQIHNHSDVTYRLERAEELNRVTFPSTLTLPAHQTVLAEVRGRAKNLDDTQPVALPYRVTNLLVGPDQPLAATVDFQVTFVPAPQ
jgi:3',5'-nucleoside bisphosphate phosphatase